MYDSQDRAQSQDLKPPVNSKLVAANPGPKIDEKCTHDRDCCDQHQADPGLDYAKFNPAVRADDANLPGQSAVLADKAEAGMT
jgi:hypothetical protein